jgi:hypothetical protein
VRQSHQGFRLEFSGAAGRRSGPSENALACHAAIQFTHIIGNEASDPVEPGCGVGIARALKNDPATPAIKRRLWHKKLYAVVSS